MQGFSSIQVAYGAIGAAAIAGLFSILSLVISKEQKVSEFRRTWLEDLRSELASFLAHAGLFAIYNEQLDDETCVETVLSGVKQEILGMNEAASRLRLRLDDDDPLTRGLIGKVDSLQGRISRFEEIGTGAMAEIQKAIVSDARGLMKREWHRVTRGETFYRAAKIVAIIVLSCVILFVGGLLLEA